VFLVSLEQALLSLVVHRPGISLEELAKQFAALTPAEMRRILASLELDGRVRSRRVSVRY
jgi:DNA-binding IclR family transcriptional regulator